MAKQTALSVTLPKSLLKAARSRQRPSENADSGTEIRQQSLFGVLNNTARNYRSSTNIVELMRHLARAEGPFATAVHNLVEVAQTNFTVTAFSSSTHQYDEAGTAVARQVLAQWDTLYDYTEGFSNKKSLAGSIEQALREVVLTGALASELVLDKARLPSALQHVGVETLTMVSDGKGGFYPTQRIAGEQDPVSLDIATFWVDYMHADPNTVTPRSMMEAALKLLVYFEEFMEEIRRVVRVSGHNRQHITLDAEKIKATAPKDVQRDPVKLLAYYEQVRDGVQAQLQTIEPEDALIMFDSMTASVINTGIGQKMDYTPLLNVITGQYATSMKTPPSVLGLRLDAGSNAIGNIETLIFLKAAKALHKPVETVYSRALTLACRLFGVDVYVRFKFDSLDLRPETELAAFRVMEQTRVLELLAFGFISDEEAANILRTGPRPPGAPKLSGTMFTTNKLGGDPPTFPGDTAAGRTMQPDKKVPRKAGGKSQ